MDPNEIERKLLSDVQDLAEQVFEDRSFAAEWMAKPNLALGGKTFYVSW